MTTKNGVHFLNPDLLERRVNVVVIGAGGSGSHMVADLAVLHHSMIDLGHPHGLKVTVVDHDTVSEANVGRARYFSSDIGTFKAQTIVHRVNVCHGLDFVAISEELREDGGGQVLHEADIVIGCVDTRRSRRSILRAMRNDPYRWHSTYMLDLGNGADEGQVILGELPRGTEEVRLPCVTDLFPEMLDERFDPVDAGPSCSRAEALTKQSAFVNKMASAHAVTLLSMLFRFGQLDHSAVFFNLRSGRSSVLPCTEEAWERFGYHCKAAASEATVGEGV